MKCKDSLDGVNIFVFQSKINNMKIGLFLVGTKGQQVLESIVGDLDIEFVLSYNDKNTFDNSFYLMKGICIGRKIPFYEGKTLPPEEYDKVDKIIIIGWQFLLKDYLNKLIIIHDSRLPEYKGWSPTVQYLIDGRPYLAATAFAPTMKMDTGDIYLQASAAIKYPMKIEKAIQIVSKLYVELIKTIVTVNPTPYEMKGQESFCVWRDYKDYFIDWKQDAQTLKRFIDAVGYPFAGAKIKYEGKILTVIDAEAEELTIMNPTYGKIWSLDNGLPTVITYYGLLKITKIVDEDGNDFKFKKLKVRL